MHSFQKSIILYTLELYYIAVGTPNNFYYEHLIMENLCKFLQFVFQMQYKNYCMGLHILIYQTQMALDSI